jgi:cold shock CspA family protein
MKASIELQDLRRRLYVKAKAEPSWRFWGLYVHVCKMETLYPPADRPTVEEFGTVKWYNATKGFNFIGSDRGGKDIFVHASALGRAGIVGLAEGRRAAVDVIDGRKGPEAVGLRRI